MTAFADPAHADPGRLIAHTAPGEVLCGDGWRGPVLPPWELVGEASVLRLAWAASLPAARPDDRLRLLTPADAKQALALALAARPGPFGVLTIELVITLACSRGHAWWRWPASA